MKRALLIPSLLSVAGAAAAAERAAAHSLANPTPREQMRELSTDRPDTTESPYSVDAGHFQVEVEAISWSRDKVGTTTSTTTNASVNVKAGLTDTIDVQAVLDPFVNVRVKDGPAGINESVTGVGDLTARLKWNLWGNDGGQTAFALMPFITLPTHSKKLDPDREVTGGLIAPLAVDLGDGWSLVTSRCATPPTMATSPNGCSRSPSATTSSATSPASSRWSTSPTPSARPPARPTSTSGLPSPSPRTCSSTPAPTSG